MVIVYTSNTGFTKEYAEMLAKAEKKKVYAMDEAKLEEKTPIFYMGPLMAGRIEGLDQALKQYEVRGVCGVGMSPPGSQVLSTMEKANYVPNAPIFYLQGGWAPKKVSWMKRRMVNMVTRSTRKALEAKVSLTKAEQAQLDYLIRGGSCVEYRNLDTIRGWMKEQKD